MNLSQPSKEELFKEVESFLQDKNVRVISSDQSRPWGGFFVIDEYQSEKFIKEFFPELSISDFAGFDKLSPKILVVAPSKRLSWQYHHRRSEIWRVLNGDVGVIVSEDDTQGDVRTLNPGETIRLKQGERHRLIGLNEWSVLAEIWQHTSAEDPSDENDIVRVEDDFGR